MKLLPHQAGVTLLCTITIIASLCTVTAAEVAPLTMADAVATARIRNPETLALTQERGIRDAAITRATIYPNPVVEMSLESGALTGSSDDSSISLGVSQEFLLGGKQASRAQVAAHEREIFDLQLRDRHRLLTEEVKAAFIAALLANEQVQLSDKSIALNRQLLAVAAERLAAGEIPELELNLAKVELARSEASRIGIEQQRLALLAKLGGLLGLAPSELPAIAGTLEASSGAVPNETVTNARPDLLVLAADQVRATAEVAVAEADAVPNITAGLYAKRDTTAYETGIGETRETAYLLGVRLSAPLPLFDRYRAGIQEARARKSVSASRYQAAQQAVTREVVSARARLQIAEQAVQLYRNGIMPQLGENLQLTQEAYRLGEVGMLAVIQEQKKFIEVNDSYLTALHDRQLAQVKLETAMGTDLNGGIR